MNRHVLQDTGCWEHDTSGPCSKCAAHEKDRADYREAQRLERQADSIESMTLSDQADRVHLRAFANSMRKRASEIIGRLQREADEQARERTE